MQMQVMEPGVSQADLPLMVRLAKLREADQSRYSNEEMERLFIARLDYPLQFYISTDHSLAAKFRNSTASVGFPVVSLFDLVKSAEPLKEFGLAQDDLVELLDIAKKNAKGHYRGDFVSPIPNDISKLIYYVCILLAVVRCGGARITGLDDSKLREGIAWGLGLEWTGGAVHEFLHVAADTVCPPAMER